jgi:GAF domain-containing protein
MTKDSSSLSDFQAVLHKHGLKAGLMFLNERVPHRYTSVYRLEHDRLRRLAFVDKWGGSDRALADVPLRDSFCEVAIEDGNLVVTDAASDERLQGRPNPAGLASYVGLPLAAHPGELFGTFCHYDVCSRPVSDEEFGFLEQAAKALRAYVGERADLDGIDTPPVRA